MCVCGGIDFISKETKLPLKSAKVLKTDGIILNVSVYEKIKHIISCFSMLNNCDEFDHFSAVTVIVKKRIIYLKCIYKYI